MQRSQQSGIRGGWGRSCRALAALLLLLAVGPSAAQDAETSEYEIKAALLCKFPKFVDWPPGTFAAPDAGFRICILGHDPFGKALASLPPLLVGTRQIQIRRVPNLEAAMACQVLFVAASEKKNVGSIVAFLQGKPVLTVGDTQGFGKAGIMINLFLEDEKVHFEVNLTVAEQAHLNMNSKMLALARNVFRSEERQGQ